jgi:hypothetical protein
VNRLNLTKHSSNILGQLLRKTSKR